MSLTLKSVRNPHVKLKSASCEKVGKAFAGIDPGGIPDIDARVVNTELYEMSAPPGNNVGAASGAGPCASVAGGVQRRTSSTDIAAKELVRALEANVRKLTILLAQVVSYQDTP